MKRARVKRVRPRMRGWVLVVRRIELSVSDIVTGSLACADAACGDFGVYYCWIERKRVLGGWRLRSWEGSALMGGWGCRVILMGGRKTMLAHNALLVENERGFFVLGHGDCVFQQ